MTATDFRNSIKNLKHGYLFYGEEDYIKNSYLKAAREQLVAEGDIFNHLRLNEETYSPGALLSAIESLPVMAEKKLVELSPLAVSALSNEEFEALCAVLERLPSYEFTVLIVSAVPTEKDEGGLKPTSARMKRLSQLLTPVAFPKAQPARLASWIAKHFSAALIVAPPDAVEALLARSGSDMYTLSSEIDKLIGYLKAEGREKLTVADVSSVSSPVKEIAAFDFANAVSSGRVEEAFAILGELKKRKEKPEVILSDIARSIGDMYIVKTLAEEGRGLGEIVERTGMHEYRAKRCLQSVSRLSLARLVYLTERCYDADIRIKSTKVDSYDVLERLVIESSMR